MSTGDSIKNGFTKENPVQHAFQAGPRHARQGSQVEQHRRRDDQPRPAAFRQGGSKLDVMVSSIGCQELLGGTLLMTPLRVPTTRSTLCPGLSQSGFLPRELSLGAASPGKHTRRRLHHQRALIEKELQYDFEKTRQSSRPATARFHDAHPAGLNSEFPDRRGRCEARRSSSAMITVKNSYKGSIVSLLSTHREP